MESSLITTKEVAEIFGKSKNAVNCWHKRGYLPAEKKIDGRLYFSKAFILEVKANYRGNISLAVNGAMNHAQIKLNFSEKFTPQFPTKIITLHDAQKLLGVDENYLNNAIDNGELSNVDGNFYTEQILQLKFSNDEFAEKKVQGNLFTTDGGIDETLDRIKAENAAQVARIDAIQINSAEWNYLLKLVREYFDKGNVFLQVPLLDENLRGQLLKILPNDSNYISVDNEVLAWCTKDKKVIETLIQTADKMATPIDENTTEPSTTENAVATPTLETLTAEIKMYLHIASQSIIEVGKRLIKAKELVPHGQWQNWLNENFNLKVRMAQNFMAIAERFGDRSNNNSKTQTFAFLKPSQLIALLKLSAGDEEKFVDAMTAKGTSIENLSVRKLKAEIKDWKSRADSTDAKDNAQIDSVDIADAEIVDVTPIESTTDNSVDPKLNLAFTQETQVSNTDSADDSNAELVDDSTANSDVKDNAQVTIDVTPIGDFFKLAEIISAIDINILADEVKNFSNADLGKNIETLGDVFSKLSDLSFIIISERNHLRKGIS